jgi:zinc protease
VETPPDRIDTFFTELNKIAGDLRAAPVSQDELTRAVFPLVEGLKQARETNQYWVGALTDAQTDPRKLESIRTQVGHYQGVSAEDLQKAAQKYLAPERAWKLEVLPAPNIAQADAPSNRPTAVK